MLGVDDARRCLTCRPPAALARARFKWMPDPSQPAPSLYCPKCAVEVTDPLTCGDCSAVICRRCGTPLESSDELGIG